MQEGDWTSPVGENRRDLARDLSDPDSVIHMHTRTHARTQTDRQTYSQTYTYKHTHAYTSTPMHTCIVANSDPADAAHVAAMCVYFVHMFLCSHITESPRPAH